MKKLLFLIAIVVLVAFGLSKFGAGKFIDSSLPGDVLYSVKRAWEWTSLNLLTFTEEGKVKLEVKFLEQRTKELEGLQSSGNLTIEKAKQLTDDYVALSKSINERVNSIKEAKSTVDELVNQIQNISKEHQGVVEDITKNAPKATSDLLKNALNFGEDIFKKTENILK